MPSALSDVCDPVVVSGLGLMTPLGADRETTWRRLLAGERGIARLTRRDLVPAVTDDTTPTPWIGGPIPWPQECLQTLQAGIDPVLVLTQQVACEAIADARLLSTDLTHPRCGCVFGTSKGGLHTYDLLHAKDRSANLSQAWPSNAATWLMHQYGITGPCYAPVAACATGLIALIQGLWLIQRGDCDLVLAGSADYSLHPLVMASFQRLGVLARGKDPETACRPFDRWRSGFVVGAGAAACVLERASRAQQRGAPIYAVVSAGLMGADPTGMTALDVSGQTLGLLISRTPTLNSQPVDLIHLHGTGTRQNDPAESRAVVRVFSQAARLPWCTSSKGALGHLLGAAGSVEAAVACLSLRDQVIPPTVNLEEIDPECALPFVTGVAVRQPLQRVLKLSLGFGGHQAVALFERWSCHPAD